MIGAQWINYKEKRPPVPGGWGDHKKYLIVTKSGMQLATFTDWGHWRDEECSMIMDVLYWLQEPET